MLCIQRWVPWMQVASYFAENFLPAKICWQHKCIIFTLVASRLWSPHLDGFHLWKTGAQVFFCHICLCNVFSKFESSSSLLPVFGLTMSILFFSVIFTSTGWSHSRSSSPLNQCCAPPMRSSLSRFSCLTRLELEPFPLVRTNVCALRFCTITSKQQENPI